MAATTGVTAGGIDPRPLPAPGWIRFRAVDHPGMGLVAELGGPIRPTGYPAREIIDRGPERTGITAPGPRPSLRLPIPLLLDRDSERGSIEAEIRMLERLHGLDDLFPTPAPIIIEGIGVPHGFTAAPRIRWAFDGDPEWGEDIRYRQTADGHRSYLQVTVTALQLTGPAATAKPAGAPRRKITVPKEGQPRTLRRIAKKADVADWRTLLPLNPKLKADPDRPLKPGTEVRVA